LAIKSIQARLPVRVCISGFLSFLLLSTVITPARADIVWGANGHPLTSYPGVTLEQQLDYLADLGLTSYRVDIPSADGAPALARLVKAAKKKNAGIEILPVITPRYDLNKAPAEALYQQAYKLAFTLVSQFKDQIRVWELGNELENYAIIKPCEMQDNGVQYNCEWGPAGGVGSLDYYGPRWVKVSAVLKGLSDGAIAADPTVRKAMGTAGWGHLGAFKLMERDGIAWDISVWHMYGQNPEWAFKELAKFGHPIWVTEFNHPEGSKESEEKQAQGLRDWMTRLRKLSAVYDLEAAHIYELMDETYWAPNFEALMGLVRLERDGNDGWRPGPPKPAYFAVQDVIRGVEPKARPASLQPSSKHKEKRPANINATPRNCDLDAFTSTLRTAPRDRVAYAYCLVLGRAADGHGLQSYATALEKGMSTSELLLRLIRSSEFEQKYSVSQLNDTEFVKLLYHVLLGRGPDGAGLAGYLANLEHGSASRHKLQNDIIGSGEFKTKQPVLFPEG
jgi:hypothetical protein